LKELRVEHQWQLWRDYSFSKQAWKGREMKDITELIKELKHKDTSVGAIPIRTKAVSCSFVGGLHP
jgi:hypothetical protein